MLWLTAYRQIAPVATAFRQLAKGPAGSIAALPPSAGLFGGAGDRHHIAMRRLVIIGCPGVGKSTLARRLGRRLGLPVVHLDMLYWRPGWQASDTEAFRARVAAAIAGDAWISDGSYAQATFDLRLPRTDAIIWVERPRWLCLWRVLRRVTIGRGRRPDLPEGCPEHLDWEFLKYVWQFDKIMRPQIEAARLAYGPEVPVIRLRNRHDISAFLDRLPQQPP